MARPARDLASGVRVHPRLAGVAAVSDMLVSFLVAVCLDLEERRALGISQRPPGDQR